MDYTSNAFKVIGGFFFLIGVFLIVVGTMGGEWPSMIWTMVSLGVLSFSMSYLYPQFKQKDERMKWIRHKAVFYSFFIIMGVMGVFHLMISLQVVVLSAVDLLNVLLALNIVTVFLTMVILARRY
ncbi:permease [Halobacillus trueperi]|uniref:Permease n=1 Tax=Halobacillus trueperi TaxID=156205 RepID=A0A3D8VMR0_9BACI|nr:permease [Halobacillus trueperi]RDY70719.1 permease [Halobacillus trueperi]